MKVWGMGTIWWKNNTNSDYTDVTKEFTKNSVAAIGWTKEQAPALYSMADEIEKGDIIYLKSYIIKGSRIKIKAIGKVLDTEYNGRIYEGHKTFTVNWLCTDEFIVSLDLSEKINNVYRNTLFREYNPRILTLIEKAINLEVE